MPRLTGRPARVVTMAVVISVPVVLVTVAAAFLPLVAVAAVLIVALVGAFVVVGKLVDPSGKATGFAVACVMAACLAMVEATPLLILRTRGEHTTATVTADHTAYSKSGTSYKYTLVTADGRKIHGQLSEPDDEFSVGDHVEVVFDPDGVVGPNDVDWVGLGLPLAAAALLLSAVAAILSIPATAKSRHGVT